MSMDRSLLRPTGWARLTDFLQLMRLDRPIGTWLLMWPTLWALWVASEGVPGRDVLLIFIAGVYVMRAAGCVVNDYADRHFDGHVKRTKQRPLATGRISETEAQLLFVALVAAAFILVLLTNWFTVLLSLGGVLLASIYPFMKRYTHFPQVVLGAAFSWATPSTPWWIATMTYRSELNPRRCCLVVPIAPSSVFCSWPPWRCWPGWGYGLG